MSAEGGDCDFCGHKSFMPYRCRYCSGRFCPDHRLPENHACEGLKNAKGTPGWQNYSAQVRRRRAAERPRLWERWDREEESGRWGGVGWPSMARRSGERVSDQVETAKRIMVAVILSVLIIAIVLRLLFMKG